MSTYYNEHDPYAVQWLRNLMAKGLIPSGEIDERDIQDVQPRDLEGFVQCHFFAGIAGWPLALRLAGVPDDEPVWTGSCPCQPFSQAGKQEGVKDKRHLWPDFHRLITECNPPIVFGEQVASRLGREWLAGVRSDLEALGYAVGAADLCAASVGAPHIRQRLFWLARAHGGLAGNRGLQPGRQHRQQSQDGGVGRLGDTNDTGPQRWDGSRDSPYERSAGQTGVAGFWQTFDIVHCTDGKARRFEPGSFPLAHGVSNRVGRLRAYGNAIVPQVAAAFVAAAFDALDTYDATVGRA